MKTVLGIMAVVVLLLLSCSETPTRDNPYDLSFDLPEPAISGLNDISLTTKQLSWDYDLDNIEGFMISRRDDTIWQEEIIVSADARTFLDTAAAVNKHTQYRIKAVAGENESDYVNSIIYDNTIPAPSNFQVVQENVQSYNLSWEQDHILGEDGFVLERKIDDEEYSQIAILEENAEIYQDDWENDSREVNCVYYRIKAYLGEEYSNTINASNHIIPTPENLLLEIINENEIRLTWEYEMATIEGFRIERKQANFVWEFYEDNIAAELREWEDDNSNYLDSYRIKAYYQEYESGNSNEVMFEIDGMIYVDGGIFEMGDHFDEGSSDELPIHDVTLSSFCIVAYEVTQGEYESMMGFNPAFGYGVGENYPVYYVTWYEAVEYCNALSEQEGLTPCYNLSNWSCDFSANGYRLPTEAEWEYAARGGVYWEDNFKCSGTTDELDEYAWYGSNAGGQTHVVGSKLPNQLGIYDMNGNVYELCNDWYADDYYGSSPADNPTGPASSSIRVGRGGSWGSYSSGCRVADRSGSNPDGSYYYQGFRLVRSLN